MAGEADEKHRRPVPRWRYASTILQGHEYSGDPRIARTAVDKSSLESAIAHFKVAPSVETALEAVHAAVTFNERAAAASAAAYLRRETRRLPTELSELLKWVSPSEHETQSPTQQQALLDDDIASKSAAEVVRQRRNSLLEDPRNVLCWLDLARAHTVLGNFEKAKQALDRATMLAPEHRTVVRSMSRFLVHRADTDSALRLIRRHPRTPSDPWLMSAEISIAQVANEKSDYASRGRRFIESQSNRPEFITELASAIGTLDWNAGDHRRARKLLRLSVLAPNENSVAQVAWLGRLDRGMDIDATALQRPENIEARYWNALGETRWEDALNEAIAWQEDEPYSSRPAINGSFLALAVRGDAAKAVSVAQLGLRADPQNQLLRNNYVVGLVYARRLEEAIKAFQAIRAPLQSSYPPFAYLATLGLLNMVAGNVEVGRRKFEQALEVAPGEDKTRVRIARLDAESFVAPHLAEAFVSELLGGLEEPGLSEITKELARQTISRHAVRYQRATDGVASGPVLVLPDGQQMRFEKGVLKHLNGLPLLAPDS